MGCPRIDLLNLCQSAVHDVWFWLALMFDKIRQQLFFGFVGIRNEFLPGAECQSANIAIGDAGRRPHKAYDLHVSVGHSKHHGRGAAGGQIGILAGGCARQNRSAREHFGRIALAPVSIRSASSPAIWVSIVDGKKEPAADSYLICHHQPEQQAEHSGREP